MAGTSKWTDGANDGDWSNASNWDTSGGGSAPPAVGDTVIISQGYNDIVAGLSQGTVNIASLQVTRGYKGKNIGTATTALTIDVSGSITLSGSPNLVMFKWAAGSVTGSCPTVKIEGTGAGQFIHAGGTIVELQNAVNGAVLIGTNCTVTTYKGGGSSRGKALVKGTGAGFTTIYLAGQAYLETERDLVTGGSAYIAGSLKTLTAAAIAGTGKVWLFPNGRFNHQSTGTINAIEALTGGTFTPDGARENVTITTLVRWYGSNVVRKGDGVSVTVTTETFIGTDGASGSLGASPY